MGRIMVSFQGDGDGVGELTWGQANLWQGMTLDGPPITMGGVTEMPRETTVEQIAADLRFAVSRHQALRTRLRLRPGARPLQVCVAAGEVPLEVIDAGDDDPAALAAAVHKRYKETPFDYEHEFPVRMAVVHRDRVVLRMIAIYLHLAMDMGGLDALLADMNARDRVTGAPAGPVTAVQPLEMARRQQGGSAQRQSAAAMKYLDNVLRVMPLRQFGEARYPDRGMRALRFRSPATALAIPRIAAQEATTTSTALLSAFAVGVARATGHHSVMAMLLVNNRFRPGFADAVSPVVQMSPCVIDVADATLGDVVRRTGSSVLTAYKHAYYDPYEQDVVFERVEAARGPLEYWNYNDRRPLDRSVVDGPTATDEDIHAAVAHSECVWESAPSTTIPGLFLNVVDGADSIDFVLTVPTRYLCDADMVALTAEFEAAAVMTALAPAARTDFPANSPKNGESEVGREVIHHA